MQHFEKIKNWSGDMVERYNSTKFGIDLLDGFWENEFYERWTDGRTMNDRRSPDDSSSAVR